MIKMVASDLDGTLLIGGRQTLPEEIFPLVKELKKWESSCGSQRQTVCQYEESFCAGKGRYGIYQ